MHESFDTQIKSAVLTLICLVKSPTFQNKMTTAVNHLNPKTSCWVEGKTKPSPKFHHLSKPETVKTVRIFGFPAFLQSLNYSPVMCGNFTKSKLKIRMFILHVSVKKLVKINCLSEPEFVKTKKFCSPQCNYKAISHSAATNSHMTEILVIFD